MNNNHINLILAIIIVILIVKLSSEYEREIISLYILDANILISDYLTDYSRSYIVTGDAAYQKKYFETENIRDGNGRWDDVLNYPWFKNNGDTLFGLVNYLDLDTNEYDTMKEAIDLSVSIIWSDITAMNWYNGDVDVNDKAKKEFDAIQGSKRFIKFSHKETDPDKRIKLKQNAIDLLYSDDYLTMKNKIKKLTYDVTKEVTNRLINKVNTYKYLIYFVLFVFISKMIYDIKIIT